jgi:hypothetical protein
MLVTSAAAWRGRMAMAMVMMLMMMMMLSRSRVMGNGGASFVDGGVCLFCLSTNLTAAATRM